MKKTALLVPFSLLLLFSGCSSDPKSTVDGQKWQDDWTKIGTSTGIDAPETLKLLEVKETLAADGLYYATWGTGDSVPYKNSDGDTIDLYDAQLYLLTNEALSGEKAKKSCDTWLSAAKENYEVHTEVKETINGQTYTILTYDCLNEDNPYDRGISAFGFCGNTAVCAEFTCLETYTEDLETLFTEFLNGCHFKAD